MTRAPALNSKRQLRTIMRRFKFEEAETSIIPIFPEVTWSSIRSRLVKEHQAFTISNVTDIILATVDAKKVNDKELMERVSSLELIDISRHHKKKMWYAHLLKHEAEEEFVTNRDIQERIKEYFFVKKIEVDVRILSHDGIIFVMMKDRPKKKAAQRVLPTFVSFFMERKYFFCTRKYMAKTIEEAVTTGLGYKASKMMKLNSRDLRSMMRMLWTRRTGAIQGDFIKTPLTYKKNEPEETSKGINFTHYKARKELADKCFGNDPPVFETLKISSSEQHWKHKDAFEKLPDETFHIAWEFRHSSIPSLLQELIIRRVIVTPLPFYVQNLLSLGRTELILR